MLQRQSTSLESKPKLLIATSNPGKLKEFTLLLPGFEILSQETLGIIPEEEVGQTFFENSLHKARFASHASGLSTLGDDSGLIVPALNNMPGLHSARYAKENASDAENTEHLKKELIKILGRGKLNASLKVSAHKFSKTAKEAIEAAGGEAIKI